MFSKQNKNQYSWISKIIFWAQKKKYGETLNPAYYWGRSPWLLLGLQVFYRCLDRKKSPLERPLRALLSLRISQLNTCEFCFDISTSFLKKLNISENKLSELTQYKNNPLFSKKEQVVLEYAEKMTETEQKVSSELANQLKKYFSDNEIIELTAWIAFQNMSAKFNSALNITAQGFCKK